MDRIRRWFARFFHIKLWWRFYLKWHLLLPSRSDEAGERSQFQRIVIYRAILTLSLAVHVALSHFGLLEAPHRWNGYNYGRGYGLETGLVSVTGYLVCTALALIRLIQNDAPSCHLRPVIGAMPKDEYTGIKALIFRFCLMKRRRRMVMLQWTNDLAASVFISIYFLVTQFGIFHLSRHYSLCEMLSGLIIALFMSTTGAFQVSHLVFVIAAFEMVTFSLSRRIHSFTQRIESLVRNGPTPLSSKAIYKIIGQVNRLVHEIESQSRTWSWLILILELSSGSLFLCCLYLSLFGHELNPILRLGWFYASCALFISTFFISQIAARIPIQVPDIHPIVW